MSYQEDLQILGIADWVNEIRQVQADFPKITRDDPDVKLHFFWRGLFSQWDMSQMEVAVRWGGIMTYDGDGSGAPFPIPFNCNEQWMMASKAVLFRDQEKLLGEYADERHPLHPAGTKLVDGIMDTISPRKQKALGREVRGFDDTRWKAVAKDVILVGSIAKFMHSARHMDYLMSTKGELLVEASPNDELWGIGLDADDPRARNPKTWLGQNWLGICLTECRELFESDRINYLAREIAGLTTPEDANWLAHP